MTFPGCENNMTILTTTNNHPEAALDLEIDTTATLDFNRSENLVNFHWMYGLEEYLTYVNHPQLEKFVSIKKALFHGNAWKIRELLLDEIHRGPVVYTEEFTKIIMGNYIGYQYANHRKVLRYVAHCIDDEFIRKISAWSIKWQMRANLNDHFSRGQMQSKLWLIQELKQVLNNTDHQLPKINEIVQYGGWYATVAHFIFKEFSPSQYYSLELDPVCIDIADDFNAEQCYDGWKFKSIPMDVNDIHWRDRSFPAYIHTRDGREIELKLTPDLIINTSCEHMDDSWFKNIPRGTLVCLQTNNYFENEQHVNCVASVNEAISKYKFSKLFYSGELDTQMYKRFMLIGIR